MTKDHGDFKSQTKRKHIRFRPDPLCIAYVDSSPEGDSFRPEMVGLIVDESPFGGCGLVVVKTDKFSNGAKCRVKVGNLDPLDAAVRWQKSLDPFVLRVGFEFTG